MSPSRSSRDPFRRAFALSIGLHLFAALFVVTGSLPIGSGATQSGGRAFETTRISYLTIERRTIAHRKPPHIVALRPAPPKTAPVKTAPPKTVARKPTAARDAALRRAKHEVPKPLALSLGLATERPERPIAAASRATSEPVRATATATASPAPSPSPSETAGASPEPAKSGASEQVAARGIDVPPGGWGQSFERPLVADESALETLRTRYHASGPVRIDVDDAGHATRVSLPASLPDDVRAELERRLLELHYIPAECNGLRCTGTLQLII
ncbi:MAG: hypothetical protein M3R53_01300 [Candidatus Eremiobacteraeota bacterium]|nr:hypothetical protein [Candidatus Eremiobacteraeota bacterium]